MLRDFHAELLLDGLLNLQQSGIAVFQHFSCVQIDVMVMLAELVGTLVLSAVVPKLVLDDQAAVEQKVDGII